MLRGTPVFRFVAKVLTQSATAVLATLIGGYVLSLVNVRSPLQRLTADPAQSERALTREYLKAMHDGRDDEVVEVRPTGPAAQPEPVTTKATAALPTRGPALAARKVGGARAGDVSPETSISELTALPGRNTSESPAAAAPPLGAPIVLEPAKLAVEAADEPAADVQKAHVSPPATPQEDGSVFSKFSTLLGNAANATGDGINFMIDLPGRALGQGRAHIAPVQNQRPDNSSAAAPPPAAPLQYAGS